MVYWNRKLKLQMGEQRLLIRKQDKYKYFDAFYIIERMKVKIILCYKRIIRIILTHCVRRSVLRIESKSYTSQLERWLSNNRIDKMLYTVRYKIGSDPSECNSDTDYFFTLFRHFFRLVLKKY